MRPVWGVSEAELGGLREESSLQGERKRTALAEANFFSVATMPPLRWAAFSADLPFTTVSRGPAAPPRVRLPILVTEFQSSDMLKDVIGFCGGGESFGVECLGLSCAGGGVRQLCTLRWLLD